MKKTIFAAIAALSLAVPATLRADEPAKEYNMVITLQNGTTITLGHNDIKNITFNGEEISISGNVVNTIEELQKESQDQYAWLKDNLNKIEQLKADIYDVVYRIDSQQVYTDNKIDNILAQLQTYATLPYVQDQIAVLEGKIANMGAAGGDPAAIEVLQAKITAIQVDIDNIYDTFKKAISDTQTSVATLKEHIAVNETDIAKLNDNIDNLYMNEMVSKDRIAELENYTRYLEDQIQQIKDKVGL